MTILCGPIGILRPRQERYRGRGVEAVPRMVERPAKWIDETLYIFRLGRELVG